MKKILFILFAALAFVACDKKDEKGKDGTAMVNITPRSAVIDKEAGGTITIETDNDAFVSTIIQIDNSDNPSDTESFFYDSFIKLKDIVKYDKYEAFGCKVIPDGFRKFTVIIEPDCDCAAFNIGFNRILPSEEHGKIGCNIPMIFLIKLK